MKMPNFLLLAPYVQWDRGGGGGHGVIPSLAIMLAILPNYQHNC